MKRTLSLFLCIALSMTMIIVPGVSAVAETVPNYEDYIPGEMPANMFKTNEEVLTPDTLGYSEYGFLSNIANTGDWVARGSYTENSISGKYLKMTAKGTDGELMSGSSNTWYYNTRGLYFGQSVIKSNNYNTKTNNLINGDIAGGKNYVYNIQVKNLNQSYTPNVVMGLYDLDNVASQFSKEYSSDGMAVEGSDWVDFKGTIANMSDGTKAQTVNDVDRLSIGLAKNTTYTGSSVAVNFIDDSNGMHRAYFAEEEAFDIENSLISGETTVAAGDVLEFEAELTNQVGLTGYLDQTFVWMAMDTNRENEISGISIAASDDTKTATVTIEDTLLPGSYDIVAYSETYNMAKGCTITLKAPYYYTDSGDMITEARLSGDDVWTSDKVSTGLVNFIEVKATLEANTEAFEWLITDKNRLNIVEDVFTITPVTSEGAEQTVKVAAITDVDVKPGDYNVVAVAKDGSVKAQPINLDITGDLGVILKTFAQGTPQEIEEGLKSSYLSVLGLLDSNSSKADKTALANVISGAAEEENYENITEIEDVREVLERLAAVSMYNVKPEGIELVDENGSFAFEEELGIDKIDTDGVSLYALYKTAITENGQAKVLSAVTGKDFKTSGEFISKLKESILINAVAYPTVNGTGYVKNILTEANMKAIPMAAGNYLTADTRTKYDAAIAGKTLTISEIEAELAKVYTDINEGSEDNSSDDEGSSGGSSGGGPSFGGKVTVPAVTKQESPAEAVEVSFADVSENHWAFAEIVFLNKLGVIDGAGDGSFYPEKTLTREEVLKMICTAFDISSSSAKSDFTDVDKSAWYYGYVAAAAENGIVNGINASEFGIGKAVTRQDICVMIMRAAGITEEDYPESTFIDKDSVAQYARGAVNYLSAMYVINGTPDGSFKPNDSCTKAEAAKIISNALHIIGDVAE